MSPHPTAWSDISITFAEWVLLFLAFAAILVTSILLIAWLTRRSSPLRPHYRRLGETAPADQCPCGRAVTYRECCRSQDIAKLRDDVRSFLVQKWSHRSFAGRRSSRRFNDRVESYPLPQLVMPDWVASPEKYSFPVSEAMLRAWDPRSANRDAKVTIEDPADHSPL
jgi:hypothetical protein